MAKKILVIDDEPDAITYIETVLADNGYEPISTTSPAEAIELAKSERPDLILLDLIMPEKSGISLFGELRSDPELKGIPVVVVSGISQVTGADFSEFSFKLPSGSEGADETVYVKPDGFVEKPVDPPELIRVIREVLGD